MQIATKISRLLFPLFPRNKDLAHKWWHKLAWSVNLLFALSGLAAFAYLFRGVFPLPHPVSTLLLTLVLYLFLYLVIQIPSLIYLYLKLFSRLNLFNSRWLSTVVGLIILAGSLYLLLGFYVGAFRFSSPPYFPSDWARYENKTTRYHYSFSYPKEWVVNDCGNGEVAVSKKPIQQCFRPLEASKEYLDNVYFQVFMPDNNYMLNLLNSYEFQGVINIPDTLKGWDTLFFYGDDELWIIHTIFPMVSEYRRMRGPYLPVAPKDTETYIRYSETNRYNKYVRKTESRILIDHLSDLTVGFYPHPEYKDQQDWVRNSFNYSFQPNGQGKQTETTFSETSQKAILDDLGVEITIPSGWNMPVYKTNGQDANNEPCSTYTIGNKTNKVSLSIQIICSKAGSVWYEGWGSLTNKAIKPFEKLDNTGGYELYWNTENSPTDSQGKYRLYVYSKGPQVNKGYELSVNKHTVLVNVLVEENIDPKTELKLLSETIPIFQSLIH